jgi:cephalosporin-C deacetylase-like acetyl esterase
MYYTNVPYKAEYTPLLLNKNIHKYSDDKTFLKRLDDHGYVFFKHLNLLIIQDHTHIAKLFVDGKFQTDYIQTMLKSATVFTMIKKAEASKQLRIIVDPHKGINDIINRRLQAVGDPDKRFTEDALRIVRAIRFVNVLNEKLKDGNIETLKN